MKEASFSLREVTFADVPQEGQREGKEGKGERGKRGGREGGRKRRGEEEKRG